MLNIALYVIGWFVFLYGQMEGSLRSSSNGLTNDFAGRKKWLMVQSDKLVKRAFFSTIFCPIIIKLVIDKIAPPLQAAGLSVAVWSASGLAGYCASGIVYQITGLFPMLRAEIPELAPTAEMVERHAVATATGTTEMVAQVAAYNKSVPPPSDPTKPA